MPKFPHDLQRTPTEAEFARLDDFLLSDDAPENTMDASMLDS